MSLVACDFIDRAEGHQTDELTKVVITLQVVRLEEGLSAVE